MRAWLPILLVAAACVEAPHVSLPNRDIIGGEVALGDHAVVGVIDHSGTLICTGTLISPKVVVSAAHCLETGGIQSVYFGSDPSGDAGTVVPVTSEVPHPAYDSVNVLNDLSVLVLGGDAPSGVVPVPWDRAPPAVGDDVRFVGFGFTGVSQSGDYGRKFAVSGQVTQVEPTVFGYGVATCNGDSGGPAFIGRGGREYVAGVTSWGDEACSEFGVDTRLDVFDSWLDGQVRAVDSPTCEPDGQCADGCDGLDLDCPCEADGVCAASCEDAELDPDCPAECGRDGSCKADCPTRDADCPATPVGGQCEASAVCEGGVCEDGSCRALCEPGLAAACPGATVCNSIENGVYACVPEDTGCGCRVGGAPASAGAAWFLAMAGLVLAARSRRRNPR